MIVLLKYQVSTYLATNPFSEKNNTSDCTTAEGHVTTKNGRGHICPYITVTVTYEISNFFIKFLKRYIALNFSSQTHA